MMFIDIECTGTNPKKDALHGIGLLTQSRSEYFRVGGEETIPGTIASLLANKDIPKVGHNILDFDIPFLEAKGFRIEGKIFDTRHMAYLIDENNSSGLKELTVRYFGSEFLANKGELDKVLAETGCGHVGHLAAKDLLDPARPYSALIGKYCIEDLKNTKQLFELLKKKLDELHDKTVRVFGPRATPKTLFLQETIPFEDAKRKMQARGLHVDKERIAKARVQLGQECAQLTESLLDKSGPEQANVAAYFSEVTLEKKLALLKTEAGKERLKSEPQRWSIPFSWTKSGHVLRLLTTEFKINDKLFLRTEKDGLALHKEGIAHLLEHLELKHPAYPVIERYAQLKKLTKLISTYVGTEEGGGMSDYIDESTGKIFPKYGSFQVTGRLSSSEPNAQNLPRNSPVKGFFVPPPGHVFLHFDASQIELRVAAHLSGDQEMIEAYEEQRDLHIQTAEAFFQQRVTKDSELRQVGKESNFLMIFKGSPTRLQTTLKVKAGKDYSLDQCKDFRDAFFRRYPQYDAYLKSQLDFMKRYGVVLTETGRMRRLPDIKLGEYINYRNRTFKAPPEVRKEIVEYIHKNRLGEVSPELIFDTASIRYSHATKQGYNFPIQGLAASIIKRAIIKLEKAGYSVVTTVHDSVDIAVPENRARTALEHCNSILSNCYKLRVPLVWEGKILRSLSESDKYEEKK
jgi:DNA polymerase I-like protein with 3'-5' exonuclease and polymerase domains